MSTSGCWPAGAGPDGCCARLSSASRQCARAASRLAGDAVMKALLVASRTRPSDSSSARLMIAYPCNGPRSRDARTKYVGSRIADDLVMTDDHK